MLDIVIGIAAVLITIIGVLLVAFMATVVFIGLLPLNYLWILARTLRPAPAPEPAGPAGDGQKRADAPAGPGPPGPTSRAEPPPGYRKPWAGNPGPVRPPRPRPAGVWQPTVARRTPPPRKAPPKWPADTAPRPRVREDDGARPHTDQLVALPSYFFGPAVADLRFVIRTGIRSCQASLASGAYFAAGMLSSDLSPFGLMAGLGVYAGLGIGGLVGGLIAAFIGVINVLVVALAMLAAWGACGVIRGADTLRRTVAGVRMTCPTNGDRVRPYPAYRCPRCSKTHSDIRPGPYGAVSRWCGCELRLPTSLLLGSGRLAASCPECGAGLPPGFGKIPDISIPFFGAVNVGKTQLMYGLIQTVRELVTASGGTVGFEGDTKERLDRIGDVLKVTGHPAKTRMGSPEGFTLRLGIRDAEWLVYFFDAAGELHYSRDGLARLKYLGHARLLVFVVDPLASDTVWDQIPAARQAELAGMRSSKREQDLAYQNTREQMREMGIKPRLARLAFAVSKSDLLDEPGLRTSPVLRDESVDAWVASSAGLDMADEVREARQGFASVEFFRTSSSHLAGGMAQDTSLEVLAQWLLRSEGIRLEGSKADVS